MSVPEETSSRKEDGSGAEPTGVPVTENRKLSVTAPNVEPGGYEPLGLPKPVKAAPSKPRVTPVPVVTAGLLVSHQSCVTAIDVVVEVRIR